MAKKGRPQHKARPSSGGLRKYGRNKIKCARYRAEGRREKNKQRAANRARCRRDR